MMWAHADLDAAGGKYEHHEGGKGSLDSLDMLLSGGLDLLAHLLLLRVMGLAQPDLVLQRRQLRRQSLILQPPLGRDAEPRGCVGGHMRGKTVQPPLGCKPP